MQQSGGLPGCGLPGSLPSTTTRWATPGEAWARARATGDRFSRIAPSIRRVIFPPVSQRMNASPTSSPTARVSIFFAIAHLWPRALAA